MHWFNNDDSDPKKQDHSFTFSSNPRQPTTSSSPSFPSTSSSDPFPDASAPPSYREALFNNEDYCVVNTPDHTFPVPTAPIDAYDQELYEDVTTNISPLLQRQVGDADVAQSAISAGRPLPPDYSTYQAEYKESSKGIVSYDKHLNEDPEALYQFLSTHNSPPEIVIEFRGFHNESRSRTVTRNDRQEVEYYTEEVTDFHFKIDASSYVALHSYTGLYVLSQPESNSWFPAVSKWFNRNKPQMEPPKPKTVRELCDEYIKSKKFLKEIKVKKQIDWDYERLTLALTSAIRYIGFHRSLTISYPTSHEQTRVCSDAGFAYYWDQTWVQVLLFITCLWIILWPAAWFYRDRIGKGVLKSNFQMTISPEEWYERHVNEVVTQVHW
ncbi:hypothetical protein BC937DRAFT_87873 [Endogone sp. FLAS-F59071]|nr:hypothetical protein BC937DRAFT_88067 [Endogone sp. FLAS-F59071]RUS22674.1 hypothetical protein BC937DRAFT_87873 [Endogone sp. FLAS-F59071]|eukprot:RUS19017.1 hypothetical protein BC937DRAFT_88067 [Endogone sp. FLAS-F59071]